MDETDAVTAQPCAQAQEQIFDYHF
jgi:hypothetical protein